MKKHKLFYNFTNITIKMVNFIQTALVAYLIYYDRLIGHSSCIYYRWICDVGFRGGGSVLGTFPFDKSFKTMPFS